MGQATPPRLTLRVSLHVPRQLHRQHRRHECGDDGRVQAAHGAEALEEQQPQGRPVLLAGDPCTQRPEAPRPPGASTPRPPASHTPFGSRPPRPGQTRTHFSCTFSCKLQGRRQSAGRRKRDRLSGSRVATREGAEYTQGRLLSPGGRTPVGRPPPPAPGCVAAPPGSSG